MTRHQQLIELRRRLTVALVVGCLLSTLLVTAVTANAGRPHMGVHVHAAWLDLDEADRGPLFDRVVDAGLDRIRIDLSWASIEFDGPGTVDPFWDDRVADVLDDAADRDLEVLAVVWQTPPWASASGSVQAPPDDPAAFGRFLASFAARHADGIDAWEIWNEPNEDRFFDGEAHDYVELLVPAAAAIRRSDPAATVVLGGPAYNDTHWLSEVYDAGARGHFDVLATHPYMAPSDLPPDTADDTGDNIWLLTHVTAVRDLMLAHGDGDKPIWFTEFGWHLRPPAPGQPPWDRGVTSAQQGQYLVRAIDVVADEHPYVEAMYWYNAREREDSHERDNTYGLVTRDLVPKSVWWAAQARLRGTVRIAGQDRIDTAIAAARLGWPTRAADAVIARSDVPSDALVATPLAATMNAPVLLTPRDRLDSRTAAELRRLGVERVTVIGGSDAIADAVTNELATFADVVRLAGDDRADTAGLVARRVPGDASVVVDGWPRAGDDVWADAVVGAGVALAAARPRAILLADATMPAATVGRLRDRTGRITVVGTGHTHGRQLLHGADADRTDAVTGATAAATSDAALVAYPHDGDGPLLLATAAAFPDGLVGSALAARLGARVALVDPDGGRGHTTALVAGHLWSVLGGVEALPPDSLPTR